MSYIDTVIGDSIGLLYASTLPEKNILLNDNRIAYGKLLSDRVVFYSQSEYNVRKKTIHENSLSNLSKKVYTGKIAKSTCSKIRTILDTWLMSLIQHSRDNCNTFNKNENYPVFITLTLCATQMHSDKFINRNMLQRFIEKYKYHTGSENIFWRAESQQNNNIHYHILSDRYIDYKLVRKLWNDILEQHKYIDEFEKKHNHRNPNSTDVKGVKDVKDFVQYVLKYVAKEDKYRKLECRLWGMSDKLRGVKACVVTVDYVYDKDFDKIIEAKGSLYIKHDYFSILFFKNKAISKINNLSIMNDYKTHLRNVYDLLYNTEKKVESIEDECNRLCGELDDEIEYVQLSLFSDKEMRNDFTWEELSGYRRLASR